VVGYCETRRGHQKGPLYNNLHRDAHTCFFEEVVRGGWGRAGDNKEDTSKDLNPLYNNLHRECWGGAEGEPSIEFGRGIIGSIGTRTMEHMGHARLHMHKGPFTSLPPSPTPSHPLLLCLCHSCPLPQTHTQRPTCCLAGACLLASTGVSRRSSLLLLRPT
jgi:hypothetical protein